MKKYIIKLSILAFISSCSLIPCTFNSDLNTLRKKLSDESIIGEYILEQKSLDNIGEYIKEKQPIIILERNGKMIYKNISGEYTYDVFDSVNYGPSGKGEWKLFSNDNELSLTFGRINSTWKLNKKNNKLIFSTYYSDPDNCQFTRFIKL